MPEITVQRADCPAGGWNWTVHYGDRAVGGWTRTRWGARRLARRQLLGA